MQYEIEENIFRAILKELCVYQSTVFSWEKKIECVKIRAYLIGNSPVLSHTWSKPCFGSYH